MKEIVKIVVHVPEKSADTIRRAIGASGGGKIGDYDFCSFSILGTGRFLPQEGAKPSIGQIGELERVTEERIEVTCDQSDAATILDAIKAVHPYEEPTIDIYPLISPESL